MDSQFSDKLEFMDTERYRSLLKVDGNLIRRMFYRGISRKSMKFFDDYVKWCRENGRYVDFIQPLSWHLYCCGEPNWKIRMYFNAIKDELVKYLRSLAKVDDGVNG